jgi:plastocyanin
MKPKLRRIGAGLAILGLALLASSARSAYSARAAATPADATAVGIDNFSFTPKEITIAKGTTVTWVNHDDVPHTVVNGDKVFRSKALDTDDQFSFTFTEPGTYTYFCSVHPMMTGKVIVK